MEDIKKNTGGMPDMALAILDKLTGLNAELSFDFDNMQLELPAGGPLPQGQFKLSGTLRIRTKSNKNQL